MVSSLSYAALWEATQEGEREVERRAAQHEKRREGTWPVVVCPPLSWTVAKDKIILGRANSKNMMLR
jgi:hypothetical protein